ncbi:MAG: 3-isopropylmalate dehydratase small subunit [Dehalococcoidia bacterium]|jgi:3-isopropylmalate/(R)-2-methylmalate dehydratase small subunit|nr:3-isopropylmalate dehydratase small subunit [Chloroflexota bacterium]MDP6426057.1 3-isopropylmalate dehydratase small subunit [Dehalococcoidia bacterium]MDP7231938.1 3-isopropylmalate dehydratase small subunit [Dehalococcoidia bacterium]MDP7612650.1 3-isopropylmalate dehydratase small subunit [Dehalococcoidia bacterium]|tara:strand:+ start:372 stop:968 length:597 start_codon:yes stop_codon:yes gene_type:complete
MEKFIKHTGIAAPLDRANVDTDQIIPKQFLKRIERTGFGKYAFFDWRYLEDGVSNPDFVLNLPKYANATILVAGRNFGSGSSREHAPWALQEMGFKIIIASSFGDIFYNNCLQNGMLPVILEKPDIDVLMANSLKKTAYKITVDLNEQLILDQDGFSTNFEIDSFRKNSLINGLDDIDLSLQMRNKILEFESNRDPRW